MTSVIFTPLKFRNLTVKNRIFRSSISGRIDNYDGSGTPARVNFEERFARGGVAAIISSHVPITPHGRVLPRVPFRGLLRHKVGSHVRHQDIGGDAVLVVLHDQALKAAVPLPELDAEDVAQLVGMVATGPAR